MTLDRKPQEGSRCCFGEDAPAFLVKSVSRRMPPSQAHQDGVCVISTQDSVRPKLIQGKSNGLYSAVFPSVKWVDLISKSCWRTKETNR
jgi:hypothetical protein